jgi:hypothetical protein
LNFTEYVGRKLRIYLWDTTYIDVFYSVKSKIQRFSYHWERGEKDGKIYRHDNIPDGSWKYIPTLEAIREFLDFVRIKLSELSNKD